MKKVEKKMFVCEVCGRRFEYYNWPRRIPRYCSKKCWAERSPKLLRECLYCGKEYYVNPSLVARKKYCSKGCYSRDQEKRTGPLSHLWKGGVTARNTIARTRAVYIKWRDSVFSRDGYQCKGCGIKSGSGKRVYLNAHHIEGFAEHKDKRYKLSNGITLCKDCHRAVHQSEIAANRCKQEVLF